MDYRTVAGTALREMGAQEVQHFLVVCALVSDLYCPGYDPGQALAKDSNLTRSVIRYKIDTAKLAAEVRAEFFEEGKSWKESTEARGFVAAEIKTTDQSLEWAVSPARPALSTQLSYASLLHNR